MYPEDLNLMVQEIKKIQTPVMIQLSTYSAQDGNSQTDVEQCILDRLDRGGFERFANVAVNGNMMSLVFARGVPWVDKLTSLNERFQNWLNIARLRSATSA